MSSVSGSPVLGLMSGIKQQYPTIRPTVVEASVTQGALEMKMSSLLARELSTAAPETIEPPLKRAWVRAPLSELSTAVSRRDWFRLMSFNFMADAWGPGGATPVNAVRVRVPAFTREAGRGASGSEGQGDHSEAEGFVDYDASDAAAELPPFLRPEFRRKHLVTLLRHYDPDIVCLNEVNRVFFNTEMWNYVRFLGYGTLYQSSRGARVRALRRGDNPDAKPNRGKVPESEDIGNVVLFHKGRFFPLMMPGRDIGRHFHFAHIVGLRDTVTNMTVYVACVQLTAGSTPEAVEVRRHEAKQLLTLLDAMVRNDADRAHMTCMVCGDLNNQTDDEPCVELLRDRLFSAHDLIGGPRWTAWHHRDPVRAASYDKYYQKNVEEMHRFDGVYTAEEEIQRFQRTDGGYHGKFSKVELVRESIRNKKPAGQQQQQAAEVSAGTEKPVVAESPTPAPATADQLALLKETRDAKGVTYNTQDFVFYDPKALALHQVLDVPDDAEVDEDQLFPNHKLPSHHLPLFIDVSWNDIYPDLDATNLKP